MKVLPIIIVVLSSFTALGGQLPASDKPAPSTPAWVAKSNDNAKILLEVMAKYSPESASRLGVEGLDSEIVDLRPDIFERSKKDMEGAIAKLNDRMSKESDAAVKQDLEILIKSAKDANKGNDLNLKYEVPYFDMAQIVFSGLRGLLDEQIPAEHRQAALVRLRRYAGLEPGYTPIMRLAEDRTRERMNNKGLLGPIKADLEKGKANEKFYVDGIPQLFQQFKIEGYQAAFDTLKSQIAAYRAFIDKELVPKAREDFRMPPEEYAFALEQTGVDIKPEELITMAKASFASIQKQMQTIAADVAKEHHFPSSDYRDVIRELKKTQLVGDAILPFYKNRIHDIEEIIRREHLVTLPDREMRIRIASEAEAAQIPAPNMRPPRLIGNTGEMGEFILPLNIPPPAGSTEKKTQKIDDFTFEAASWTLTSHEGRPGHEMQFASVIERGVSTTRALFAFNSVNVEGWGLYSEAIMLPYMPLEGKLISLQHRLLRSARAFLDPQLQLGKMTKEEAMNVLLKDVVMSDGMSNQEVERYTFRAPGQATSYFYGYTRLMELRTLVEKKMGKNFNQQKFHDFVLAQGLLPPELLKQTVMTQFVPAQ